jgi:hypothetical protein
MGLGPRAAALVTGLTAVRPKAGWLLIGAGLVASLAAVWVLRAFPNSSDEYDYLFQAHTFLSGRLWNPVPPLPEMFSPAHVSFDNGKWFTFYPPGWPLILAVTMGLQLPAWFACPVAGGVLLFAAMKLGERRDGRLGGILSGVLSAASPFFVVNAGSYFNHVPAAAAGLLFCWAAAAFLDRPELSKAVLAGVALGVLGLVRTEDVLVFALPFLAAFCWRAGRRHYRLAPAIVLAGLPFLAALLLYYHAIGGSMIPDIGRDYPMVKFGLHPVDEAGRHLTMLDELRFTATRLVMLAEWTSPLLMLGYVAAFVGLAVKRRLSFLDLIFPLWIVAYWLVPFTGGNQYGPRYYFEPFPLLVLTIVSALVPLLQDPVRSWRRDFAAMFVMAHIAMCVASAFLIGLFMHTLVDQRMDLYDLVRAQGLHNAVVIVHSSTSPIGPMEPPDLVRDGTALDGDVIYALDIPNQLAALRRVFPQRQFYVYRRAPRSARGTLRKLGAIPPPSGR